MSWQQWAAAEKMHNETVMKKKKRASISLLLHLSLDEERKIAATELSITYELQPIRAEFLSEDKVDHNTLSAQSYVFLINHQKAVWFSDTGRCEVKEVTDKSFLEL